MDRKNTTEKNPVNYTTDYIREKAYAEYIIKESGRHDMTSL